jgi:hypothetical protein
MTVSILESVSSLLIRIDGYELYVLKFGLRQPISRYSIGKIGKQLKASGCKRMSASIIVAKMSGLHQHYW